MVAKLRGAEAYVPLDTSIESMKTAVQDCRGCELYKDATQAVLGRGPDSAELMVVGEQPGDQEDRQGEPFVGPAGKLLDKALEDAGIPPDSVYRTNVVKHFRFSGTRGKQRIHKSPSRVHVAACEPWLLAELDVVRPTGAVLLGATAGKALYGSSFRVGEVRGRLIDWPEPRDPAHADRAAGRLEQFLHVRQTEIAIEAQQAGDGYQLVLRENRRTPHRIS